MALGIKCAYATCGKYSIQVPYEAFFPFPTDLEMRTIWVLNSGLFLENSENHVLFLCKDHFSPDSFINASLKKDAIPIPWGKTHELKKRTTSQILSDYFMQMCKSCGDLYSKNGPECDCNAFKDISCTGCNLVLSPSKLLKHECSQVLLQKNCIVSCCNSNSKVPTISLPEDVNLKNAWLERIPISRKYHTKLKFVVCLKHFKEEDIVRTKSNVNVKEKAIPEIFNVPLAQDRGVEKCCLPYCRSNHFQSVSLNNSPIITFQFPIDSQAQRRKWVNAIFKQYISHINEGSICIKHFQKNQVFRSGQLCYLSHGAVPSKFFKNGLKPNKFVSCCVPGCITIIKQGIDFFPFPRHGSTFVEVVNSRPPSEIRDIHELWLERIGISDVTELTVICKNHFSDKSILFSKNNAPYLQKSAVPTLNLSKPFDPCIILDKKVMRMKRNLRPLDLETLHSGGEEDDLNRPCSKPKCLSHLEYLPERTIHKLPKSLSRARSWAVICGCPNWLDHGIKQARKNIRICIKHFQPSMLLPNNRLRLGASPFADDSYVKCAVDSCNNYFDETRAEFLGKSYFVFPENPTERLLWLTAINKPFDWNPSQLRICFRHFRGTDVLDGKLIPNAVPKLYIESKFHAYRPYALNEELSLDEQPLPKDNDNWLNIDNPLCTPPVKRGRTQLLNKTVKKIAEPKKLNNSVLKRKVGKRKKINNISANTKPSKKKPDEIIAHEEDSDANTSLTKKEIALVIVKQEPNYNFQVKEEVLENSISDLLNSIKEEPVDNMDVSKDSFLDEPGIDEILKN